MRESSILKKVKVKKRTRILVVLFFVSFVLFVSCCLLFPDNQPNTLLLLVVLLFVFTSCAFLFFLKGILYVGKEGYESLQQWRQRVSTTIKNTEEGETCDDPRKSAKRN